MKVLRDEVSAPFFDAAARGELLIRRCSSCGHLHAPQASTCPHCGSGELAWTRAAGTGRLETWMVAHDRSTPPARTAVGIVELDEGPWLQARIVDVDPDRLAVGQRLVVGFEVYDDGEPIPVLRPE